MEERLADLGVLPRRPGELAKQVVVSEIEIKITDYFLAYDINNELYIYI